MYESAGLSEEWLKEGPMDGWIAFLISCSLSFFLDSLSTPTAFADVHDLAFLAQLLVCDAQAGRRGAAISAVDRRADGAEGKQGQGTHQRREDEREGDTGERMAERQRETEKRKQTRTHHISKCLSRRCASDGSARQTSMPCFLSFSFLSVCFDFACLIDRPPNAPHSAANHLRATPSAFSTRCPPS